MKILHTSDWHLGKKLEGFSRLPEQRAALRELTAGVKKLRPDVLLVAGDIYDTSTPAAEAEQLFFEAAIELAALTRVVIVAGNHDDASRLSAPSPLARLNNIYLIGGLDNGNLCAGETEGGTGYIRFFIGGEKLNIAALPFPAATLLESAGFEGALGDKIAAAVAACSSCFGEGVNVFLSHLFVTGGVAGGGERELGSALLLPPDILPSEADYIALGHIHRCQKIGGRPNAWYSGSLLPYSFDDTAEKGYLLYDTDLGEVTRYPLAAGRPLLKLAASDFEGALTALEAHPEALVQLLYDGPPLSASETKRLKSCECLKKLTVTGRSVAGEAAGRTEKSSSELFKAFFKAKKGTEPSQRLIDLFLEVAGGEQ